MPNPPSRPSRPQTELRQHGDEVRFALRVQPRASRDRLRIDEDGRAKASVTAAPAEGEANAAVCKLLAREFGVSKTAVRVVHGDKSRDKIVAMRGIELNAAEAVLCALADSQTSTPGRSSKCPK